MRHAMSVAPGLPFCARLSLFRRFLDFLELARQPPSDGRGGGLGSGLDGLARLGIRARPPAVATLGNRGQGGGCPDREQIRNQRTFEQLQQRIDTVSFEARRAGLRVATLVFALVAAFFGVVFLGIGFLPIVGRVWVNSCAACPYPRTAAQASRHRRAHHRASGRRRPTAASPASPWDAPRRPWHSTRK